MTSLPPALNFAETEEEIVKQWQAEQTFHLQNKLSLERGDEVRGWNNAVGIVTNQALTR